MQQASLLTISMLTNINKILIFILVTVSCAATAQDTKVKVLDKLNNEPVPFANVIVTPLTNNTIISSGVTDIDGNTVLQIENKSLIKATYVGYQTYIDTVEQSPSIKILLKPISYNVDEVVVTGQYGATTQDKSIYKVKVINSSEIQARGAVNLTDMLSTGLNFRVNQDNALGASIEMQGLGGEHIKYLIDGVPVIGREDGNIDPSQLNLQNVDHIEIVNGPMSVVYGSNALAGVINIITKPSDRLLYSSNLDAYYESVGVYNINMSASGRAKRNSFGITAGRNFFDGYQAPGTPWQARWKPKRQINLSGEYKYNWDNANVRLSTSYFNQEVRDNGQLIAPDYVTRIDKYYFTNRFVTRADFQKYVNANSLVKGLASYSAYSKIKNVYLNDLTTLNKKLTGFDQDTTRFRDALLRLEYSHLNPEKVLGFQAGVDLNNESGYGKRIKDNEQSIGNYALFASLNYTPISTLIIQPGLRLLYNTDYKAPLIYSFNIKYSLNENIAIRGSIASGFRSPSLKELYLDFADVNHDIHGNPDLKAETSVSTNVMIQYSSQQTKNYEWGVELNLFNNNIKNNIQLIPTGISDINYTYENVNRFITRGFEVNFNNKVYPVLTLKIGFTLTGQELTYESLQSDLELYTGVNTTLLYDIRKIDANISLFYKYNGKYPQLTFVGVDEEPEIFFMSPYNTLDITFSKKFWMRRINLQVGGKNLFNVQNVATSGPSTGGIHTGGSGGSQSVGWGRTFFVRLMISINK